MVLSMDNVFDHEQSKDMNYYTRAYFCVTSHFSNKR